MWLPALYSENEPVEEERIMAQLTSATVAIGVEVPLGNAAYTTYLDSDYGVGRTGADVDTWAARVGGQTAIKPADGGSTGTPPSFDANGMAAGRSAIVFDGVTEYLLLDALGAVFSGEHMVWTVAVHCMIDAATTGAIASAGRAANANTYIELMTATAAAQRTQRRDDVPTGPLTGTGYVLGLATEYTLIWTCAGTTVNFFSQGVIKGAEQAQDLAQMTIDRFTIGAFRRTGTGATAPFPGKIRRLGVMPTNISPANAAVLDGAWRGK